MRFAQTLVSPHGFRDPAHNPHRLALLREALARLVAEGVELVAIPAGFLTVDSDDAVTGAISDLAAAVDGCGVAVVGGVDVEHPKRGKADVETDELTAANRLPYFGFAAYPTAVSGEIPLWRQASTTSGNADLAPDESLPDRTRLIEFGERTLLPLLCGEVFNWRIRERAAELAPRLVIDLGHIGMGQGLIPATRNVATGAGCAVAHTQHVGNGSYHFVSADGEQQSEPTGNGWVGDDEFWIGWRIREV